MPESYESLARVQQLVADMTHVERHHRILGTERRENVVEHSFAVALFCWRIADALDLDLDMGRVFKYVIVHDLPERGQARDTNTYASEEERRAKMIRELEERDGIVTEFRDFADFTQTLLDYDALVDDEASFVWTVDKIQALIYGEMDDWFPYSEAGVTYGQYCAKGAEFVEQCYPPIRELFAGLIEHGRRTYYDQPEE